MYRYQDAVDRGTFVQPRCFARMIPGKSWAGALITDEDPDYRWHNAINLHNETVTEILRALERETNARWSDGLMR